MKNPELNAWCDYADVDVPRSAEGPLAGLTLAVKDIYPVAGYPNGWGSPTRLAEAEPDTGTQPAIQKLLDAGAEMKGKSQCDELCFSLRRQRSLWLAGQRCCTGSHYRRLVFRVSFTHFKWCCRYSNRVGYRGFGTRAGILLWSHRPAYNPWPNFTCRNDAFGTEL